MAIQKLIVIDFETLGTDVHTCPVLSLGVVIGDIYGNITDDVEFIFPLADQFGMHCNKRICSDTLEFWQKEENKATFSKYIAKCFSINETFIDVLGRINKLLCDNATEDTLIVANAPAFDCEILKNLFAQYLDMSWPFTFRQEFDFRTVRNLFKMSGIDLDIPETDKHNALADAKWEYDMVCKYISYLDDKSCPF